MTLIKTPFGFRSTAAEVAAGIDLTGKRAIVTGASSGIGIETARTLADAGAQLTLAAAGSARIVVVSSSAHLRSPVVFDDLHFRFRPYDPLLAYGQSKTAAILFAVGATARGAADGITANALNPGAIATNLQRHVGGQLVTPPERRKTPEQGAATSVLLATSPDLEGIGGRYFDDCNEAPTVDHRDAAGSGVASYAFEPANAHRLWDVSDALLQHA